MKEQEKKVTKEELQEYEPPCVEVYNDEEFLKYVAVLGCYPFPPT